jgi:hypothetical protein
MPPSSKTVHVYQDATLKASPTVNQTTGAWDAGNVSFSSGDHALKARAEDIAGNFSGYTQKNVRFGDNNVPALPDLLDDSGESSVDNITNDDTPRIKVTLTLPIPAGASAVAQASVGKLILVNAGTEAEIASEVPNYTAPNIFDYTFQLAALTDGIHGFRAKWADALDNPSNASAALEITVDTQAPDVPSITSVVDGQVFVGTSIPVSGSVN